MKQFQFHYFRLVRLALVAVAIFGRFGPLAPASAHAVSSTGGALLGYIGTYTGKKSKGIYAFRLDASGRMTQPTLVAESENPTFLAVHPNQKFLYAANEIGSFNGKKSGGVTAFAINAKTGELTPLNEQPSGGDGPCHLVVDATGKNVLVANYGGGSIEVLPVQEDGRLGEPTTFIQHQGGSVNKQRQEAPHAHFITTDPANRFALTCDLGLDKVLVYSFDAAKGSLAPNDPPSASIQAGSGPRHLAFHPNGRFAYVINEMACTLTAFTYDSKRGELKQLQNVSTLPPGEDLKPNFSTAEVEVHPSGKFLFGSNRGHDSIAVFSIDQKTGRLTHVENQATRGKTPRNFAVAPGGKYLLAENQDSDSIAVFRIDPKTGRLSSTDQMISGVGAPVCIKFLADKRR
jgi:6-phosphogluconolactonase